MRACVRVYVCMHMEIKVAYVSAITSIDSIDFDVADIHPPFNQSINRLDLPRQRTC